MPNSIKKLEEAFKEGKYDQLLKDIYVDESVLAYQQERYIKALESFEKIYGEKEVEIYSAPGRSEVGGNHTDHQFGKVLATSINLDAIAIVAKRDDDVIDLKSEGYERIIVSLSSFDPAKAEKGTSQALIQGVASKLKEEGYKIELAVADRNIKFIPHNEMPQYYNKIDIYICASRTEGSPDTVIEAMACGIPVISTDVGIVPEVFGEKQKEFIIERTKEELKKKIINLISNKQKLKMLSDENLKQIQKWDWKNQGEKYKEFFERNIKK